MKNNKKRTRGEQSIISGWGIVPREGAGPPEDNERYNATFVLLMIKLFFFSLLFVCKTDQFGDTQVSFGDPLAFRGIYI